MPISIRRNGIKIRNDSGYSNVDALFAGDVSEEVGVWLSSHPPYGYITPEMFGAIGDGNADDTTAIQAAIDSGGEVIFSKIYKITHGILLKSNSHIRGFGKATIVKTAPSNLSNDYAALYYSGNEITNVLIDGITLVGIQHWTGESLSGLKNDVGIRINNANKIKISNCIVKDFGGCGIMVSGKNVDIVRNSVTYSGIINKITDDLPNYNFGISYDGESFRISDNNVSKTIIGIISGRTNKNSAIINNDISETQWQHAMYIEGAENLIVSNNHCHDCAICGVKIQADTNDYERFENIIVEGNEIVNCSGQGILVIDEKADRSELISNVVLSNNIIINCMRGINASKIKLLTISGNQIVNSFQNTYAMYLGIMKDAKIIGNNIKAIDSNAIHCYEASQNIDISNNSIYIEVSDGKDLTILGICIAQTENFTICNNVLIPGNNMYKSDGIYILDGIASGYIFNNIAKGFRWDLRFESMSEITLGTNYIITQSPS